MNDKINKVLYTYVYLIVLDFKSYSTRLGWIDEKNIINLPSLVGFIF